jgi:cAMP-dependent protein kinase regulator
MDTIERKTAAAADAAAGRYAEAIAGFKAVLKENKDDLQACLKLAELYVKTGQKHHAVRFYEVAAKRTAAKGDLPKAVTIAKIIKKLDPAHTDIQALLSRLYADQSSAATPAAAPDAPPVSEEAVEEEAVTLAEEPLESADEVLLLEELEEDDVVEGLTEGPATGDLIARLPKVPIFSDLDRDAFETFIQAVEVKLYEQGEAVVVEGDPGDSFFIIASGSAKVVKRGADLRAVELAVLPAGAFFGEFAYLSGTPRTATVLAADSLEVLEVSRPVLDRLVGDFPSVRQALEKFYRDRARHTMLAVSPLFQAVPKADRETVASRMTYVQAEPDEVLIEQGDAARGLFIVAFGEVAVNLVNEFGGEELLAHLGVGDFFGEMSLLFQQPASARVTALRRTACFSLDAAGFAAVTAKYKNFADVLAKAAQDRQKKNEAVLSNLELLGEEGLV